MIHIYAYLSALPGAQASEQIGETKLNEILLNSMSNCWIKQAYVQCFDCKYITSIAVNMFECTEILEYIYEGVVGPYYKNLVEQIITVLVIEGK